MSYPPCLITNSYNILGLNCSATLSEVRKRSQLLLQLAKIDEIEHFKTDIGDSSQYRIESEIRKAQERLSGIKERLYETFFWLESHTAVNKKVIQLIAKGNCQEAITILENSKNIKNDWLSQKNLALSFVFLAFSESDISAFKKALEHWKQIKDSQVFWDFYEKYYLLNDEIGTSSSLFKDFQKEVSRFLTKISSEFYKLIKDPEIIGIYFNQFEHIDEKLDSEILQPIILKIRDSVKKIEEIVESDDLDKKLPLDSLLHRLSREYVELCKFGLCSYSPIAVLKDNVADRLKSASVTINNKYKDYDLAIVILLHSEKFVFSKNLLEEIQKDKMIFYENQKYANFVLPRTTKLKELIENNKLKEAYNEYLELEKEFPPTWKAEHFELLLSFCAIFIKRGNELMNNEHCIPAANAFSYSFEILIDRLYLFSFNEVANSIKELKKFLAAVASSSQIYNTEQLTGLFERVNQEANIQNDENLQMAIKLLGDAIIYENLAKRIKAVKKRKMWKWIGWGIAAIVFYFFVIRDNDNSSSNTTPQTTYHSNSSSNSLTSQEKQIIKYLQKNNPKDLKEVRAEGFSDKEIAQYLIQTYQEENK